MSQLSSSSLTASQIEQLVKPYVIQSEAVPVGLYDQLARYLELLLKWNARTNLTAIRNPGEIVQRHFGESLFAAQLLGECETLLDYGSGAGFPGLPIQLLRPDIHVTLAESQHKKSSFLREAVRTLNLSTEVWDRRVEEMHAERQFDVVALRAVDRMEVAVVLATERATRRLLLMTTNGLSATENLLKSFNVDRASDIPLSDHCTVSLLVRR